MMSGSLKLLRWAAAAAAFLLVSEPAFAEKRVALVLGNSNYQNVAPLANPVNDSARIAATLKDAGFDVVDSRRDLAAAETRRALRDFADRAHASWPRHAVGYALAEVIARQVEDNPLKGPPLTFPDHLHQLMYRTQPPATWFDLVRAAGWDDQPNATRMAEVPPPPHINASH